VRVGVYGLGYVGCVSAACLGRDGHDVFGVDVNHEKVARVRAGKSPVIEPRVEELLQETLSTGRLHASTDPSEVVGLTDVSLVCVGTPSNQNGSLNLEYIEAVCAEIGRALGAVPGYHVVVIRSTVLPGTVERVVIPILEKNAGRRAGEGFGVCMNPEFLREGRGVRDYYEPPQIVIGELDVRSGETVEHLYQQVNATVVRTSIRTAEMVKYASNAFHAVKIVFANEMGSLCKAQGVDGQEMMDIFCRDDKLNISQAYLRPGYAFGGSCLPKDLRALLYRAKQCDTEAPMLEATLRSNDVQIQRAIQMVESTGRRKVGVVGLSFKAGTDDVRESPMVALVETLVGRGYQVGVYDPNVDPALLIGANRSFLERELPHIASLMHQDVGSLVEKHEVIVVGHDDSDVQHVLTLTDPNHVVIDLVGIGRRGSRGNGGYYGIGW
jgi:GDP-mannose 6-dehydrogenase